MAQSRVGISGWTYAGWRRVFYPKGLAQHAELEYASRRFNSIEINGTFYSLQLPSSFRKWYEATPATFVFAVKGSRFITHMKKLKDPETPLANFFASGILLLKEKLGPILWQFPAQLGYQEERFSEFLELLPTTTRAAAALARKHDARVQGRAWTRADKDRAVRHAFEIRHPSFLCESFIKLLRRYNAALVVADTAGTWPYAEDVTADFVYVRLHGATELYTSGYGDEELDEWAAKIQKWSRGSQARVAPRVSSTPPRKRLHRDVFVYFDNDRKVRAPFDALRLAERLGLNTPGKRRERKIA